MSFSQAESWGFERNNLLRKIYLCCRSPFYDKTETLLYNFNYNYNLIITYLGAELNLQKMYDLFI